MKTIIVANWKMNPQTLAEAKRLFASVERGAAVKNIELVICPPFVYCFLFSAFRLLGAQNCFWQKEGAYTGEISPQMLKSVNCRYVIVGHSERRKFLREADEVVNKKIKAALEAGLKVIVCVAGLSQAKESLKGINLSKVKNLIIAYEPIFAVGTGRPCSINRAEKMRILINKQTGGKIPVLYGGSVTSQNADHYVKKAGFQGLLIGGSSIKAKEFLTIVKKLDNKS